MQRLVGELLTSTWVRDLFKDLGERQAGSAARAAELQRLNGSSPIFWPFHAPQMPLCVTEAKGSRLRDVDGNEYLDCHMGWGAQALHGHSPDSVVEFVRERLSRGTGNGYFHPIELELVGLLRELMPHNEKYAFFNSGTDATSAAIRLARAHTGKRLVAKVEGSLHGIHDLAMHNTAFWYHGGEVAPEMMSDGRVAPTPALAGVSKADERDLLVLPHHDERAFALIERHRHELACVIAEPMSSSFPFGDASIPFVKQLSDVTRRARVPFVLDEVLTGFRSGIAGVSAHYGIDADLICYGKVISGLGLPLSAIGGRADLIGFAQTSGMALTDFGRKTCLNTTHMGNYLSLCASFASLSMLKAKGARYYDETRGKVQWLQSRLEGFRRDTSIPIRLVGFGDFIGSFSFLSERPLKDARAFQDAINPIALYLLTLMLRKRGVHTFSMPLFFSGGCHSQSDIEELYLKVTDAALEMKANNFTFLLEE